VWLWIQVVFLFHRVTVASNTYRHTVACVCICICVRIQNIYAQPYKCIDVHAWTVFLSLFVSFVVCPQTNVSMSIFKCTYMYLRHIDIMPHVCVFVYIYTNVHHGI